MVLDRSQFDRDLDKAKADADKFSGKDISVKVKADNADADEKLDKTKAKADDLGRKTETIKVKADTTQATAALDKLREKSLGARAAASMKEKPWWMGPAILALPGAINLLGVAAGAATAFGATVALGRGRQRERTRPWLARNLLFIRTWRTQSCAAVVAALVWLPSSNANSASKGNPPWGQRSGTATPRG